jgi:hypothetical protein
MLVFVSSPTISDLFQPSSSELRMNSVQHFSNTASIILDRILVAASLISGVVFAISDLLNERGVPLSGLRLLAPMLAVRLPPSATRAPS